MRYIFMTHVNSVFELKTEKYSGRDEERKPLFSTESKGWYIRLGEGENAIAMHLGTEQPPIKSGQKVRLIIEVD